MGTQSLSDLFIHIRSRNPIAIWAIENLLAPGSLNWRVVTFFPRLPPIVSDGVHILLIDSSSILEWPETVHKWTLAGHKTILLVPPSWGVGGAALRALHLGVRGIVHASQDFARQLPEAVELVAKGNVFASREALGGPDYGARHPPLSSSGQYLSFREEQVMDLLMAGFSNRKIGGVLGISERTAKFHVCNILRKLNASTRRELADKVRTACGQRTAALPCDDSRHRPLSG